MRKSILFFILVIIFSLSSRLEAQEKKEIVLNGLSLSSGQGPLSSGLFFEANFSRGNDLINLSLGEKDMYVIFLKKYKRVYVGPSFEYYHNTPTLGIMTILSIVEKQKFSLSTTNWSGISAGKPQFKTDLFDWQFLFFWHSIDMEYKRISLTVAALWYDEWGQLFDLKYTQPINSKIKIFGSAGYSFYKEGSYLFKIGIKYKT